MRKICPKCNGNGYHKRPWDGADIWLAPLTLGISLIREIVSCKICDGKGYLEE